ncbi:GT4_MtfB-like domain containing protein [Burkholderiaceae bacterium]
MTDIKQPRSTSIRVHLTNVVGAGASQLLLSLLPALESNPGVQVDAVYLPDKGPLQSYVPASGETRCITYHRRMPNAISRILECTIFGGRFNGSTPLLVLGDLPVRCKDQQVLFVQTTHLVLASASNSVSSNIKFWIARLIFALNQKCVSAFIVQTEFMRSALLASYPALQGRVHIVSQPVPTWLLENKVQHHGRSLDDNTGLKLFYPAAAYPHKNHQLLAQLADAAQWPVESLQLTLEPSVNPSPTTAWIKCTGFLSAEQMRQAYAEADALLFLSLTESYGFPLIEAMFIGLPIICPDLPYARALCGAQAIYFEANDIQSLRRACIELKTRLLSGWQPDWSAQIKRLPQDWDSVASQMLDVIRLAQALPTLDIRTH